MKRTILSLVVALLSLAPAWHSAGAAPNPADATSTATEIEGDWRPISIRNGDNEVPKEKLAELEFSFRGDQHTLITTTESVNRSTAKMRVDPTKDPKEIDLDLGDKQPAIIGIYKLEGDKLTIVFSRKTPTERPKAIPAKPEAGLEIVTLSRIAAVDRK